MNVGRGSDGTCRCTVRGSTVAGFGALTGCGGFASLLLLARCIG